MPGPKRSHAEIPSLNFQKGLNDLTRKKNPLEIECLYLVIISSYQMILSFPYLVVILTTLGTPKNIFCINNNIMNDNSKQNKTTRARTSLVVLYLRNYAAGIHGHYHESSDHFEYPKKSILKSSHPKKYLPNLHTQKNPGIENFKPKKILRSSPSLEVRSTPPVAGIPTCSNYSC